MGKEKIKVLKIEPMEHPSVCYIEPSMKAFRKAVNSDNIKHGGIETKKLDKKIFAVFNMDRILANLEPNRHIGDDIIAGNMYIVAVNEKRFPISLTEEQISKYSLMFWYKERFDDMDVVEANLNTLFSRCMIDENW